VVEVRDRLARLGLLASPVLGDPAALSFDASVDEAVRIFQQSRALTVDGIVGPETFRRLEEARWSLGDRVLSFRAGHLIAGDDVAELQQRLTGMGFDLGRVDGVFGSRTDGAVREFQRNVGLQVDGMVGLEVFRALEQLRRTVAGGTPTQLREELVLEDVTTGVAGKVVVVDPARDDSDPGPVVGGLVAGAVIDRLAELVEGKLGALGTTVLLTRPPLHEGQAIGSLSAADRAELANRIDADLLLSIDLDSHANPTASGCASFFYGGDRFGASSVLGERAATAIQSAVLARTDLLDCRTHPKTWATLRLTRMPAVRVVCGYLTSPRDRSRLADQHFVDALAEAIALGVMAYFSPDRPST